MQKKLNKVLDLKQSLYKNGEVINSLHSVSDKIVNMNYEHAHMKNKISFIIFFVLSIIFAIIGLIVLFFSWKVGLIILIIVLAFFGLSKLSKWSNKLNKKSQDNYNEKYAFKSKEKEASESI